MSTPTTAASRFSCDLGPEMGPAVVKGVDFGVIGDGERLKDITGFFTQTAAAPQR